MIVGCFLCVAHLVLGQRGVGYGPVTRKQ
uniref:Uncharacterized protein n=1 Tax=Arundo donax TaxID=35708 RepID=A0A0A8YHW2_ARUDO